MKHEFSIIHFIIKFLRIDLERLLTFGYISRHPHRQLVFGYFAYMAIGSILLCLPFMTTSGVDFIDNMFSATSAVSTTGLTSVDVAKEYTFWGQLIILFLIQIGGIGYMTMGSFVMYSLTKHFTFIKKGIIEAEFATPANINAKNIVSSIVSFTFLFESLGSILLYFLFKQSGVEDPLWAAVFHAVSAFCTAGFSTFSTNLMQFDTNTGVNLVIIILSYAGAMGFIVMTDLWRKITVKNYKITFTTRIIVIITILLSTWGTAQMFFFEPSFAHYSMWDRLIVSLFQTMSALTTVGYNSVNIGDMLPVSLITLTMIMYFGASPSGTGGGLKSTTLSATFAFVKSKLGFRRNVYLLGRALPTYRIDNALTTFALYTAVVFFGSYLLVAVDDHTYLQLLFEAVSALGTVGLTTGITMELTDAGKMVIIVLMFIGRVGVLTIGYSMLKRMQERSNEIMCEDDLAV